MSHFALWTLPHKPHPHSSVIHHLVLIGICLFFFFLIQTYLLVVIAIQNDDLGLFPGSTTILMEKLTYSILNPQIGDVTVFELNPGESRFGVVTKTYYQDGRMIAEIQTGPQSYSTVDTSHLIGKMYYPKPHLPQVKGVVSLMESPTPVSKVEGVPTKISSPTPANSHHLYHVTVRPKTGVTKPTEPLPRHLLTALTGSDGYDPGLQRIVYDTSLGSPYDSSGLGIYNFDYFIVTKNPINTVGQTKDMSLSSIAINPADPSLLPFILNSSFCQVNADCQLRQSLCTKSAYNKYESFKTAWACRGTDDGQGNLYPRTSDACTLDFDYTAAVCQANRCQAQEKREFCID